MSSNLPLFYFTFFGVVFGLSILLNSLFLKFSGTLGIRKGENIIRWSATSKPALGGITFYITFLFSIIVYSLFFQPTTVLLQSEMIGLLCSCTVAFLMGLADDAYDTNPMLKFSSQAFCGIIFIFCGISINIFSNMYLNYCITMVWVVGLMNSINLLDNMDAVSSVAIIGALLSLISVLLINHYTTSVFVTLEVGMLSAVCAFLLFNWHPSKMFMGDTGTQFLGAFLASASILFLWNNLSLKGGPIQAVPAIQPGKNILSVLLTFALPIMDTTVVFINRLLKGTSPFVGGKDHTTHHLYYLGMKERQIALLYGAYSALCFLGVVAINKYLTEWSAAYEYITGGFLIASFVMLFVITRVKKQAI